MKNQVDDLLENKAANLWQTYQDDAPDFWEDYDSIVAKAKATQEKLEAKSNTLAPLNTNFVVAWADLIKHHLSSNQQQKPSFIHVEKKRIRSLWRIAITLILAIVGLFSFGMHYLVGGTVLLIAAGVWKVLEELEDTRRHEYTFNFTPAGIDCTKKIVYTPSKQYTINLMVPYNTVRDFTESRSKGITLRNGAGWADHFGRKYRTLAIPQGIENYSQIHHFLADVVKQNKLRA